MLPIFQGDCRVEMRESMYVLLGLGIYAQLLECIYIYMHSVCMCILFKCLNVPTNDPAM
jgi:hypothetical protein